MHRSLLESGLSGFTTERLMHALMEALGKGPVRLHIYAPVPVHLYLVYSSNFLKLTKHVMSERGLTASTLLLFAATRARTDNPSAPTEIALEIHALSIKLWSIGVDGSMGLLPAACSFLRSTR